MIDIRHAIMTLTFKLKILLLKKINGLLDTYGELQIAIAAEIDKDLQCYVHLIPKRIVQSLYFNS